MFRNSYKAEIQPHRPPHHRSAHCVCKPLPAHSLALKRCEMKWHLLKKRDIPYFVKNNSEENDYPVRTVLNSIARTTIGDPREGLCKVKSGQKTLSLYAERTKCTAGQEQSRAGCGRHPGRPTPVSVPLSSHLFIEKESQA